MKFVKAFLLCVSLVISACSNSYIMKKNMSYIDDREGVCFIDMPSLPREERDGTLNKFKEYPTLEYVGQQILDCPDVERGNFRIFMNQALGISSSGKNVLGKAHVKENKIEVSYLTPQYYLPIILGHELYHFRYKFLHHSLGYYFPEL